MSNDGEQGGFWHKPIVPRGYHAVKPPSKTEVWETPAWLFRQLDEEFHFTVDVAAHPENAKCERYYTIDQDGLQQSWAGERVWCNPPYDHKSLTAFSSKAIREIEADPCTLVVLLVPPKSDQAWWHECAMQGEVRFIRGRVAFGGTANAPMPVCAVVLSRGHTPSIVSLERPQTSIFGGGTGTQAKEQKHG
jgi:phage N-6-adenine-methyltransferase